MFREPAGGTDRNPNRWKRREAGWIVGGKKIPTVFLRINLGDLYIPATRFGCGFHPKRNGQTTTNYSENTKAPRYPENKKHKETRKFLWSSLHWFTISSSSKHCTQVGGAKNRADLDPPLLWRRGSHLFRQQAWEPRQTAAMLASKFYLCTNHFDHLF